MSGKTAREERRQQRLRKEEEAGRHERRRRMMQLASGAAFLAVVAVAALIVVSQNQGGGGVDLQDVRTVKSELSGIPQSGLTLGEPQAKVTLIEFGDLQCPVCKEFAIEKIPPVITSKVLSGEAKIEFRNFTIIGPESVTAGAAAIAAGKQGRGWDFLELFYRNQGEERSGYVTDAFLTEVAKGAGVRSIREWNADRKSKAVLREVSRTTAEAQSLGFEGTPSFAVEGPSTSGLRTIGTPASAGELETAIDAVR